MCLPSTSTLQRGDLVVLVSCQNVWFFEPEHMRFCQVPKTGTSDISESRWTPYRSLEVDTSGWFVVVFNDDYRRVLRSWVHVEPCPYCDTGLVQEELPLDSSLVAG